MINATGINVGAINAAENSESPSGNLSCAEVAVLSEDAGVVLGWRLPESVAWALRMRALVEIMVGADQELFLDDGLTFVCPLTAVDAASLTAGSALVLGRVLRASEALRQLDTLRGQSELAAGLLTGLGLDEGVAAVFGGSLSETAALLDGLNLELRRELLAAERFTAADAVRGVSELPAALREVATWGDRPGFVLVPTALVTVSLSPAATFGGDRILRALETLTTRDRGVVLVETAGRLADGLTALDRARLGLTAGLPEALAWTDVLGDAARVLVLAERMALGEGAFGLLELLPRLREALSGQDVTAPVLGLLAGEALELIGGALLEVYFGARAAEALTWAQDATAAREIGALARELAVLAEGIGFRAQWGLADGLLAQVLASPDAVAALLASDRLDLVEIARGLQELTRALAERWRALDAAGAVLGVRAETLAILGETADPQVVRWLKAAEPVELAATVQAVSEVTARLTALGRLLDSAGLALGLSATGGLGLTDTLPPSLLRLATLRQSLGLSATSAVLVELAARLLEGMTAAETAALVQGLSASETATLADQLTRAIWAELTSAEGLALADATERSLTVVFRADDALDLDDASTGLLELLLRAGEQLAFIGRLPLADGDYQAWVINTDTLGVTQYAQFPFDALVTHTGTTLGLTATGLYELTGDTDDGEPIAAWIRTGDLTLGGTRRSSVPRAYLYVRQDGDLILKTTVNDRGHRAEHWYRLTPSTADGADAATRRVRLGRGVRGVSWAFEIANVDGADFDLRGCEVLPVVLSRRV